MSIRGIITVATAVFFMTAGVIVLMRFEALLPMPQTLMPEKEEIILISAPKLSKVPKVPLIIPIVTTDKPKSLHIEESRVVIPAVVIPEIEIETPQVELPVVTPKPIEELPLPVIEVSLPIVEVPMEEPVPAIKPPVSLPPTIEKSIVILPPVPPPVIIDEPVGVVPSAVDSQKSAISSFPHSGMMCLTFDDGWGRRNIERILNALRRHNVRATLFVIGHRLKAYPHLWNKAISDGHEIAYHSMDHKWKTGFSNERIVADIERWETIAREVLGEDYVIPKIARLPGGAGHRSARVLGVFNNLGYTVVGWCTDTLTGVEVRTAENKAAHVLARARPGAVILQHFNELDARATELYIDRLVAKGIPFGLVSEALTENKANRPN